MNLDIITRLLFPCLILAVSVPGGAAGKIVAVTETLVEVMVGQPLVLPCSWNESLGRSTIKEPELGWFIRKGSTRTRIFYKEGTAESIDSVPEYFNRVSIKDEFTLVIDRALPIDSRVFTCQVSAGVDGMDEGKTVVNVFAEPEVKISGRVDPVQVTGNLMEVANCTADNVFPVPKIMWYKDDQQLNVSADVPNLEVEFISTQQSLDSGLLSVTSTLNYRLKKTDRKSNYQCMVNYKVPGQTRLTTTEKIELMLHYPAESLQLVVESHPWGVKERDNVILRCITDANPPPTFDFFKDGVQMTHNPQNDYHIFHNIGRDRTGNYSCHASGNVFVDGSKMHILMAHKRLLVNYIDSLTVMLTPSKTIMVGQTLNAMCKLTANPELQGNFTWTKNGKDIGGGEEISKKTDYYDSGNFTCIFMGRNAGGLKREAAAMISVHGTPMFASVDEEVTLASLDEPVELVCEALGFPLSIVLWSLPKGMKYDTSQQLTTMGIISKVKITVFSGFPALVKCIATNRHGETEKSFTLMQVKNDSTNIIIIVIICIIIATTIAVVLGLFFTKKACFAKKGSRPITEPTAESIPLNNPPSEVSATPNKQA